MCSFVSFVIEILKYVVGAIVTVIALVGAFILQETHKDSCIKKRLEDI